MRSDLNLSDPKVVEFLTGVTLYNYSVLANVTNNGKELGFEWKSQRGNFFAKKPCVIEEDSSSAECPVFSVWSPYGVF